MLSRTVRYTLNSGRTAISRTRVFAPKPAVLRFAHQTTGQAPQSSRKPVERNLPDESSQNPHLRHKSSPNEPDHGQGAASPNPELPSHSGSAKSPASEATPDLYLKDDGSSSMGLGTGGITEDEGAGDVGQGTGHKYVVSEALPSEKHYDVPSGAYLTTDPYEPQPPAEKPKKVEHSSTSTDPAHPLLSKKASRVEDGVGSSSAVRHGDAPGRMKQGAGDGVGLQDPSKTSENKLADRNPGPTAEMGRQGIDEAWKHRK
ncbi:hypothetical protein FRC02_012464 [Tulasnella sp. 418]|nr:hypothetical protein FRC02_012464 [Tulasnella sp. 418]